MNAIKAKNLLLPIPKEDFITDKFTDNNGKCCAIGHLMRLTSKNPNDYHNFNCSDFFITNEVTNFVRKTVADFNKTKHDVFADLSEVNNEDTVNGYTQDNPKDRVIALLDDMIKKGL